MPEKLDMKTKDITQENIAKIQAMFPNVVTETIKDGKVTLAVDFDVLKQEMSSVLIDDNKERYQFTWPDKKKAVLLANQPISATLRPCKEESVDFDKTQNLYIEGDNLDVLKLLRETYLGKVKMIYIDPPYNTGNDFVYKDDFAMEEEEYKYGSGQYDEQGNRLVKNPDSNGRFHTDWLNMIYPRLKVAKDLLSDDGVIFISIDDNEVENLRKICDEIFGEHNFVGQTIRVSSPSQNIAKFISIMHDYTLVYCKNKEINGGEWEVKKNYADEFERRANQLLNSGISEDNIASELRALTKYPRFFDFDHYTLCDKKGVFQLVSMGGVDKGNTSTIIYHPITKKSCAMPQGGWRYKEDIILQLVKNDEIYYGQDEKSVPRRKYYLQDYLMQIPKGVNFYDTQNDVRFLKENNLPFDFPKPKDYIIYFISMIGLGDNDVVLDFFSGSATTAHAVMQLNAEDGGNRRFIMVQIPEKCDENSEACKAGYKNICEIGKERIRRAGKKIKEETGKEIDYGFRVLKLDSSNMQEVYYNPNKISQTLLEATIDNVKTDRTPMDLLFQVMLDLGVELSAKIEEKQVNGKRIFVVNDNDIIACFDDNIDNDVITVIAKMQPLYAIFKDKSFATDSVSINNEQLFKTYSPTTVIKVI